MSQLEVLIRERFAVDTFATSTVAIREIPPLAHESRDNSMKGAPLKLQRTTEPTATLFTSAKASEILCCLGNNVRKQFEGHSRRCTSTDRYIKVDLRTSHCSASKMMS